MKIELLSQSGSNTPYIRLQTSGFLQKSPVFVMPQGHFWTHTASKDFESKKVVTFRSISSRVPYFMSVKMGNVQNARLFDRYFLKRV